MSCYVCYALYGQTPDHSFVSRNDFEQLESKLCHIADSCLPASLPLRSDFIASFTTTGNHDYEAVSLGVQACSESLPDFIFALEIHNVDEDWHQKILFHNGDMEYLKGYIDYENPKSIFYPESAPQKGASIQ